MNRIFSGGTPKPNQFTEQSLRTARQNKPDEYPTSELVESNLSPVKQLPLGQNKRQQMIASEEEVTFSLQEQTNHVNVAKQIQKIISIYSKTQKNADKPGLNKSELDQMLKDIYKAINSQEVLTEQELEVLHQFIDTDDDDFYSSSQILRIIQFKNH